MGTPVDREGDAPGRLAPAPGSLTPEPDRRLATDAIALLQGLIRFDTVNPPGNERPAIEYLHGVLEGAGFDCELLAAEPGRPNLVARLRADGGGGRRVADWGGGRRVAAGGERGEGEPAGGRGPAGGREPAGDGPTLCFLGHVDTVLADASEWSHGPFSGDEADGFVWGRGALDMKSQVAAEVAAAVSLARSGWRPAKGELMLCTVVDEETGGGLGAKWLTENHPEKVRCDMLINEGGGPSFEVSGRRYYGVCCAEKGVFRFTIATDGVAGHASMPKMGVNALLKMAPVLERLAKRQPSLTPTAEPLALLEGVGEDAKDPAGALARLATVEPRLAPLLEPMFGVTFTPTKIRASEKINVIPSSCELRVDCRVPPGLGEAEVRQGIAEVLGGLDLGGLSVGGLGGGDLGEGGTGGDGPGGLRIEFTEKIPGNRSPIASPLRDAIDGWVAQRDPDAQTVPTILPGFTDSAHFRAAFPDCVAYGFFPHRHQGLLDTQPLIHGADERIDVRDMALGAECYRDLAVRLLG